MTPAASLASCTLPPAMCALSVCQWAASEFRQAQISPTSSFCPFQTRTNSTNELVYGKAWLWEPLTRNRSCSGSSDTPPPPGSVTLCLWMMPAGSGFQAFLRGGREPCAAFSSHCVHVGRWKGPHRLLQETAPRKVHQSHLRRDPAAWSGMRSLT